MDEHGKMDGSERRPGRHSTAAELHWIPLPLTASKGPHRKKTDLAIEGKREKLERYEIFT